MEQIQSNPIENIGGNQSLNLPESKETKEKRNYSSSACNFCKKRHWKCDGNKFGCKNCVSRNELCIFSPTEKKRGRKRPDKGSVDKLVKGFQENQNQFNEKNRSEVKLEAFEFSIPKKDEYFYELPLNQNPPIFAPLLAPQERIEEKIEAKKEEEKNISFTLMTSSEIKSNTPYFPYDLLTKEDLEAFGHIQKLGNTPQPYVPKKMDGISSCVVMNCSEPPDVSKNLDTFPNDFYLPPTLCYPVGGRIQDCQTVASWLFMYERAMRTVHPFLEVPLVWKVRRDHIIRDPSFSNALYSDVSTRILRGRAEEFVKDDPNELIDNIRVKAMMAFGAKFTGNQSEALELIKTCKEMIKPIEDQLSLALGWTFILIHTFYMGEGDILNVIWSNNCSTSISSRLKLIPNETKEACYLEIASYLAALYTCYDPEERSYLYAKTMRLDPEPVQETILWLSEVIYQSLLEIRTGTRYNWEEGKLRRNFVVFQVFHSSYEKTLMQTMVASVMCYLHAREDRKEEAIQNADAVAKLVSMGVNYCGINMPSCLLLSIYTYFKLGCKSKNYYGLIKTCDRFSNVFPVIGWHLNCSILIPKEDIEVANSMVWP